MKQKLHGSIILTYRCNAKCNMCDVWHHPTKPSEEIGLDVIEKLPEMFFANVTGGEPTGYALWLFRSDYYTYYRKIVLTNLRRMVN
jgi:MoaA/NifB/PqqE/SkfB family radical SAM enzyme